MSKILIINGDDFGYTQGINNTLIRCHQEGLLTSATLMANGQAFDHAVTLAKENPGLSVGAHLVLTELAPLALPGTLPSLVDDQGLLPASPGGLFLKTIRGQAVKQQIRLELELQVTKILDHGIKISHLDAHMHVQVLPEVFAIVAQIAVKYGIKWVRNPFDETSLGQIVTAFREFVTWPLWAFGKQYMEANVVKIYRRAFARILRDYQLHAPEHFFGTALTGIWTKGAMRKILQDLPDGVNELMVHPGECDEQLRSYGTRLQRQREQERDLLLLPEMRELVSESGISLRGYGGELRHPSASWDPEFRL